MATNGSLKLASIGFLHELHGGRRATTHPARLRKFDGEAHRLGHGTALRLQLAHLVRLRRSTVRLLAQSCRSGMSAHRSLFGGVKRTIFARSEPFSL
jgi:hypothetical protein